MDPSSGVDGATRSEAQSVPSSGDEGALRGLQARRLDLRRQLAEVEEAIQGGIARGLARRMGDLERRLDGLTTVESSTSRRPAEDRLDPPPQAAGASPVAPDALETVRVQVAQGFGSLSARLDRIEDQLAGPAVQIDLGTPARSPDPSVFPESDDLAWHGILFGQELAHDPALAGERSDLIADLKAGDPTAGALAGQLLVFHSAPDPLKPQLLKDLGEAFYRWKPKLNDQAQPMEVALASWLETACEAAGVRRKIELVRPGSRFNASYHKSNDRGVEVAEVSGWVILREDGSVYQKATVGVR